MKHAVQLLENHMEIARNNEPIHRAQGDAKQARLCKAVAWDCLEAIQILKREMAGRKSTARASKTQTPSTT